MPALKMLRPWLMLLAAVFAGGLAQAQPAASTNGPAMLQPAATGPFAAGAKVYREACAACHDAGLERAPQRYALQQMTPEAIHRTLTQGAMQPQAAALSAADKVAVAEYLAERKLGSLAAAPVRRCTALAARFDYAEPPVFGAWGFDPGGSHAIPAQQAGLSREDAARLSLEWAFAFPGATRVRSQPVLAGGALYIGSQTGMVYALDRASGCVRWTFEAGAEVRTSILIAPWRAGDRRARPLAWFGDTGGEVYALDARTGRLVWKVSADAHPVARISASPALFEGVLYVPVSSLEEAAASHPSYTCCTFRGSIVALDAASGKEKWRTWLVDEARPQGQTADGRPRLGPSGVPVWSAPVIDVKRRQLLAATGNNYSSPVTALGNAVVAIDLASGKINWARQVTAGDAWNVACAFKAASTNCPEEDGPDFDFGASPIITLDRSGRDVVLAGQKSGIAYGLDPGSGAVRWQTRIGRGGAVGGIHFGIAAQEGLLFAPVNDAPDGKHLDFPLSPGLYAIDAASGAKVWSAPNPDLCKGLALCHNGLGAALTAVPGLVLAGASDGHLRIYDAQDGKIVWDYDTLRSFQTVNRVPGNGGAIAGGAAPVVYRGRVFVGSGYGFASKLPGNVLLVFGPGKSRGVNPPGARSRPSSASRR